LLTPEEERERHARIEHLIAHAILALTDTQKREIGAIVAVLKWLEH
jgi:hypothetical protein